MATSIFGAGVDSAQGLFDPFALWAPFAPKPVANDQAAVDEQLPNDLPAYLVYVTRNALLAGTGTLSRAWTEIYKFFVRVSWLLAFERLTREMLAWQAANPVMAMFSGAQGQAASQSWLLPAPPETPLLPFWGPSGVPALPKPETALLVRPDDALKALPSALTACAAMLAIPATLLATMPMITNMWPTAV